MHLFGLTGGIASGKSTVSARLRARKLPIIDADLLAREVVEKGTPGLAGIVEAFGAGVLAEDGSLDRRALGKHVFADDAQRRQLNAILHPLIGQLTQSRASALAERGEPLACYEAALIVENGMQEAFRPLVVVAAPHALQLQRVARRDHVSLEEAEARVRSQKPLADKIAVADYVIETTGTLAENARRTDTVLAEICARLGVDLGRYPEPPSP